MPIINLGKIEPGDVILERGHRSLARATNHHLYGHASLALGRLVCIQAGKDDGVLVEAFDAAVWEKDGQRFIGIELEGNAEVRRPVTQPQRVDLVARAVAEAGRGYIDIAKLQGLSDLTASGKNLLQLALDHPDYKPANPADLPGRFCSEVVARVLGMPDVDISPNALAQQTNLRQVADAVVPSDGWHNVGRPNGLSEIMQRAQQFSNSIAPYAWTQLLQAANALKGANQATRAAAAQTIEAFVDQSLTSDIKTLNEIASLEKAVFRE
jgi:hypothetical protein